MRWVLPILILIAGAAGFMVLQAGKPPATVLESTEKAWIVAVMDVIHVDRSPTLTLYGRVESPQIAGLSAALTADVLSVSAFEGEDVRAGATLVVLDHREAELVVRQREAEAAEVRAQIKTEQDRHRNNQNALLREKQMLELSRMAVSRAGELAANNVGSQSQLDNARQDEARQLLALENRQSLIRQYSSVASAYEAKLARAEALAEQAKLDLSRCKIVAPFTGRVSKLMVASGDRVQPGQVMLKLIDTSRVEIRAQIPTRQLPKIRSSLSKHDALLAHSFVDGRSVESTLDRLTGEISLGAGGVDALFRVTREGDWLQLGRTLELVMQLPQEEHVVPVPLEAIYGNRRLYKLVDNRMQGVEITNLGKTSGHDKTWALVRSSELVDGDLIIVTQLPNAIDGLRVRIAESDY